MSDPNVLSRKSMSSLVNLTKEQIDILETKKNTIVIANPGTGKTTTLSHKVILLLENGVKPEDILCITYTEKAKKEMFDKIYEIGIEKKIPDSQIMKLHIHTFHSFAYNYLVDNGFVTGDIVGNNLMRYSILESFEKNRALNYGKDYIISEIVPKTENAIRYIKSFGILYKDIEINKVKTLLEPLHRQSKTKYSIDELNSFLEYFIAAYKYYEDSKKNAIDYSDMLLMFKDNFTSKKFQYVLVDEMQDMNDIEAKITDMIGETLFLVGDAKQAIFGFQGGSVKNFLAFAQKCEKKLLTLNMRSTQQILDYSKANFLLRTSNSKLYADELNSFTSKAGGEIPKIISTPAVMRTIFEIIQNNHDKTIGIITRNNFQIIEISKFLDNNNISYSSSSSQATTKHAKTEIITYLIGSISEKIEEKINAALTVFSPFTLKEAFEFSSAYKKNDQTKLDVIKKWNIDMSRDELDKIFKKIILPLCVSKGAEWYSTAVSVKEQIEEYLTYQTPTLDGLKDFLQIGEESYVSTSNESRITLTTVHKAKGRAFDIVIYVPKTTKKTSFIDMIVSSILSSHQINISNEILEESLRVDFVAFTRAREKLFIITNDSNSTEYHIQKLSQYESNDTEDDDFGNEQNHRLSEAYSLFLAQKIPESQDLLEGEDDWLTQYIQNYFKNMEELSFSKIIIKPYEFMKKYIIKMPFTNSSLDFGGEAHIAIENVLQNKTNLSSYTGNILLAVKNSLAAKTELEKKFPGLQLVDIERNMKVSLETITGQPGPNLMFTGKLDALFKHDSGYLIVDFKTNKKNDASAEHKRQLTVYKKMLSVLDNISEDRISVCVVYVALRDNINTGKFGWGLEYPSRDTFATFLEHLQILLDWISDPDKFIAELVDEEIDEPLYEAIAQKLQ